MAERKFRNTTREGHLARIYARDGSVPYVIHGAVKGPNGWMEASWDEGGRFNHKNSLHAFDLIPLREPSSEAIEAAVVEGATQEWRNGRGFPILRSTVIDMLRAAYAIDGIEPAGE